MSEFTPINTQEEFEEAIGERMKQERKIIEDKYKNYLSPEDAAKKYEGYLSAEDVAQKYEGWLSPEDAAEKESKLKKYETDSLKTKIAHEMGLKYDAIGFLQGEDEKSIKKSAEALKGLMGSHSAPPVYTTEPAGDGKKSQETAAFKAMLANMKGE